MKKKIVLVVVALSLAIFTGLATAGYNSYSKESENVIEFKTIEDSPVQPEEVSPAVTVDDPTSVSTETSTETTITDTTTTSAVEVTATTGENNPPKEEPSNPPASATPKPTPQRGDPDCIWTVSNNSPEGHCRQPGFQITN